MKIYDTKVMFLTRSKREAGFPMVDVDYPQEPKSIKRLANAKIGSGHSNFLSGITVAFKIKYTAVFAQQFQRYHFVQIVSSQSKMHCLGKVDVNFEFSEHVSLVIIDVMKTLKERYIQSPTNDNFYRLVDSCPQGLLLTMGVRTNYLQLKTIYSQRNKHKYYGWNIFCDWIKTLPECELIIGEDYEL